MLFQVRRKPLPLERRRYHVPGLIGNDLPRWPRISLRLEVYARHVCICDEEDFKQPMKISNEVFAQAATSKQF